jgi:hypothetical protein
VQGPRLGYALTRAEVKRKRRPSIMAVREEGQGRKVVEIKLLDKERSKTRKQVQFMLIRTMLGSWQLPSIPTPGAPGVGPKV